MTSIMNKIFTDKCCQSQYISQDIAKFILKEFDIVYSMR